jgi:hypothetical protein
MMTQNSGEQPCQVERVGADLAAHPADPASRLAAQLKPVTKCSKLTFVSGTHPSPTLTLRASRAGDLIKGGV